MRKYQGEIKHCCWPSRLHGPGWDFDPRLAFFREHMPHRTSMHGSRANNLIFLFFPSPILTSLHGIPAGRCLLRAHNSTCSYSGLSPRVVAHLGTSGEALLGFYFNLNFPIFSIFCSKGKVEWSGEKKKNTKIRTWFSFYACHPKDTTSCV